ncbi:hypothetical protein [Cognatilysobacter terrigena]|uniref:hypothetical protein n=1 Tax=Cognatilysobacter terrigena TaxID=2488749 RepID=UPI00105BD558|nr:hypothetical protein [Lysobacter terrigena]
MHAFKLSMTAGAACSAAPPGATISGMCLVNDDDASLARDAALLALNSLGFESCTFLDVAKLPASPDLSRYNDAMRQAYEDARREGVAVMLYGPDAAG